MDLRVMHPTGTISPEGLRSVPAPRSRSLELGLGLIVIVLPLAFLPVSMAPFLDVKLAVLCAGTLFLWLWHTRHSQPEGPSKLAAPAAWWVAAMAVAGIVGVDRWWSLTGPENSGAGLLLLGPSAALLVVGTRVPDAVRGRIPLWLVGVSTAAASVVLVARFWPSLPLGDGMALALDGGPLGQIVFVGTVAAIGVVAVVALPGLRPRALVPILVVLSSGLALSTRRVGWIALAAGLAVALWRTRVPRKRMALILSVVVSSLLAWTIVDAVLGPSASLSGARRFGDLGAGSAKARMGVWGVLARGWADRPILGWGPGNAWSAYEFSITPSELHLGRGWGDSHNILIEVPVTTGIVGLAAFLVMGVLTTREIRRGSPSVGWAAGAAGALFVHHLVQPLNVALTPLLFLSAGLACRPLMHRESRNGTMKERSAGRPGRLCAGILLAAGLAIAAAVLVSSVLERYGRTYASEWALRGSLALQPGRLTAGEALAMSLALDARSGDRSAGAEAQQLIARMVRLHPWNPGVRLVAADVHTLMRDPAGAAEWKKRHFARFPGNLRDLRSPVPPRSARPS